MKNKMTGMLAAFAIGTIGALSIVTTASAATLDPTCARAARANALLAGPLYSDEYMQALSDNLEHCWIEDAPSSFDYEAWLNAFCSSSGRCYKSY